MNISELFELTQVYEATKNGIKNARSINRVYKYIPNVPKSVTKNTKIKYIWEAWEKIADETMATMAVTKQIEAQKKLNDEKEKGNNEISA